MFIAILCGLELFGHSSFCHCKRGAALPGLKAGGPETAKPKLALLYAQTLFPNPLKEESGNEILLMSKVLQVTGIQCTI
jgi:hypothetical protein